MYLDIIFNVIGGLGIFLYGMENMSGGMQKLAGRRLKKILAALTTNRFMAIIIGIFITMLVQSSSVSTVMTIGFVNASLLTLKQALGVILGANIGTTVTGWLLVLNIGKYGLPITGAAAIAYVFFKGDRARTRCLTFMGLGLIFLGLTLMSNGLKPIRTMPQFIELFKMFNADTYFGAVKVAIIGACITGIVQSSAATLGITITLAVQGLIDYPTAVALVLGENVGTTITAFLASIGATINAKRAAYAHTIINAVGVIWITAIFPYYIQFLSYIVDTKTNIVFGIATAHTMFNILNVFLFIPFTGPLSNFLEKVIKSSGKTSEKVTKLDKLMVGTPAIIVEQTKVEVLSMGQHIKEMMFALEETFAKNEVITDNKLARLQQIEFDLDLYQKEIADVNFLILNKNLTDNMREETRNNLEISDEYETISDYLMRIAKSIRKIQDNDIQINDKARKTLFDLNEHTEMLFREVNMSYETRNKEGFIKAISKANEISAEFREARNFHIQNVKEGCSAVFSTSYMDILNHYRRIRDHIFNIIEVFTKMN